LVEREVEMVISGDGSNTLFVPALSEHYHSTFGAVAESMQVFIRNGFSCLAPALNSIHILEIGFGTGLNAFLTLIAAETAGKRVIYHALEPFPLEAEIWERLNYPALPGYTDFKSRFGELHRACWDRSVEITPGFTLYKSQVDLKHYLPPAGYFQLVYFDAFGPSVQPELWTEAVFSKLYKGLNPGGILTTYSVKGTVVRAVKDAGFTVEKLPGPPGKRHIMRATKELPLPHSDPHGICTTG